MNKRRRAILDALAPAVEHALKSAPAGTGREVPGLSLTARVNASAPAELYIYGQIGASFFMDGVTASDVANLLTEAGPGPVNVRINSPGGDVFQGVAIHSLLARHPGTVTTYVDGLAASAASFIMLAGDRIVAARNAFVMIHDAMTYTYGNGNTHRSSGELLDKVSDSIADMYAERAGEDAGHWRNLMTVNGEDGTWYTGAEAMDAGLVDEITAVADESDDEVAARLSGWQALLPERARAFLAEHPVEEATEEEETEQTTEGKIAPVYDADETGRDLAFAMLAANLK